MAFTRPKARRLRNVSTPTHESHGCNETRRRDSTRFPLHLCVLTFLSCVRHFFAFYVCNFAASLIYRSQSSHDPLCIVYPHHHHCTHKNTSTEPWSYLMVFLLKGSLSVCFCSHSFLTFVYLELCTPSLLVPCFSLNYPPDP
ncbi:hypothetical protein BJ165DRAFT_1492192 [Panaeolus papilionaceus]|nr:hypothetical protein BJ165DRAFT_1492192 [Panaeolus papilionaceus]